MKLFLSRVLTPVLTFLLNLVEWLLSFVPGTKAHARRKLRETVVAALKLLEAQSQKRYPGAKALWLRGHGTYRSAQRSMRRMFEPLWLRAYGKPLSGRQWVRLRFAATHGVLRSKHDIHVGAFLGISKVRA